FLIAAGQRAELDVATPGALGEDRRYRAGRLRLAAHHLRAARRRGLHAWTHVVIAAFCVVVAGICLTAQPLLQHHHRRADYLWSRRVVADYCLPRSAPWLDGF